MTAQLIVFTPLYRKLTQSRWAVSAIFFLLYGLIASFYFWVNHEVRPVWLDEALTYYQVADRSFVDLIRSFDYGVNLLPYSYFIFPWAVGQITELDPLALRLPSLMFGVLALLVVHKLIAVEFGNLIAFTSVFFTFIVASEFQGYLSEARPYSLYTLVAALHLCSALAIFKNTSRRNWTLNAVAAAMFPSVQFVGLVYSFALAAALFVLEGNRFKALRVLSSFCLGWVIFIAIHFRLLWLIFSGKSLSDPDAFARPTLSRTALEFNQFFDLPAEVSVCLIILLVLAVLVRGKCEAKVDSELLPKVELPSAIFIGVSVAWLVVPLGLKTIAALGFFNLTVPRYLLPTLIANAMLSGLFLSVAIQLIDSRAKSDSGNRIGRNGMLFAKTAIVLLILLSMAECLGIQLRVVAADSNNGQEFFGKKLKGGVNEKLPVFTNDAHNFTPYAYHKRNQSDLDVSLVLSEPELRLWKNFAPQMKVVALEDVMSMNDQFLLSMNSSESSKADNAQVTNRLIEAGYNLNDIPNAGGNLIYRVVREF